MTHEANIIDATATLRDRRTAVVQEILGGSGEQGVLKGDTGEIGDTNNHDFFQKHRFIIFPRWVAELQDTSPLTIEELRIIAAAKKPPSPQQAAYFAALNYANCVSFIYNPMTMYGPDYPVKGPRWGFLAPPPLSPQIEDSSQQHESHTARLIYGK